MPRVDGFDAGVITEARRRQRRHRAGAAAVLIAAAIAVGLALLGGGDRLPPRLPGRSARSLRWLTGAPLTGDPHIKLLVAGNDGPAAIIDVGTGRVQRLTQLGAFARPTEWSPSLNLYPLRGPGRALAVVSSQGCQHCTLTEVDYVIAANGTVRRIATRHFPADAGTTETSYMPGTSTEWVLTRPGHGPCTLHQIPSGNLPVTVTCGDLGPTFAGGAVLWTQDAVMTSLGLQRGVLVNPRTGVMRRRLGVAFGFDPVGRQLAIESAAPYPGNLSPGDLSLVNLETGQSRRLGWPSTLHFGYQVYPDLQGPLVAIEFGDPAYPPPPQDTIAQAADIWVLNTLTGTLTHLPGFPSLMYLKISSIAWTSDHRLVIAAAGGGRTTIAIWRPGEPTLHLRTVPDLDGYSRLVALTP